jgi:hypothetical protein
LAAESALVTAKVPSLQIRSIQTSRVALLRQPPWLVFSPSRSLQVLLAAVLLDFPARRRMSIPQYDSGTTSNDLLERLVAESTPPALNYQIVAQSAEDVQNIENAPAVSIGPYLLKSRQTHLLTTISIYSLRGESRKQIRPLYMNAPAIRVWEATGNVPEIIGAQVRPPRTAILAFGVPFSK